MDNTMILVAAITAVIYGLWLRWMDPETNGSKTAIIVGLCAYLSQQLATYVAPYVGVGADKSKAPTVFTDEPAI
jgi:uncharacterized membrane protein